MRTAAKRPEKPAIVATARQIAAWRATKRGGEPMPKALWDKAVELSRAYGLGVTARGLHIDYGKLQKMAGKRPRRPLSPGSCAGSGFVDLGTVGAVLGVGGPRGSTEAMSIELQLGSGDKLTIRLSAGQQLDIVGLIRELRGQR
jgi:hypothetical protein